MIASAKFPCLIWFCNWNTQSKRVSNWQIKDFPWLIQKEKVNIYGEKSAQMSIAAKKTVTQRWLLIMVMGPEHAVHYSYFVFLFFSVVFILLLICILFKIGFGRAKISVSESVNQCLNCLYQSLILDQLVQDKIACN